MPSVPSMRTSKKFETISEPWSMVLRSCLNYLCHFGWSERFIPNSWRAGVGIKPHQDIPTLAKLDRPAGRTPVTAAFVPPPVLKMNECLGEWEKFLHMRDAIPDLIQCAMMHAQLRGKPNALGWIDDLFINTCMTIGRAAKILGGNTSNGQGDDSCSGARRNSPRNHRTAMGAFLCLSASP